MKNGTLLELAKEYRGYNLNNITDEHIELVLAWLKGEVRDIALRKVLGQTQSYSTITRALKKAYELGKLKIV